MVDYKHFENEKIRMTASTDNGGEGSTDSNGTNEGIKIVTDNNEYVFYPNKVILDPVGDHILYIKFNHKEHLVLYHYTRHPESRNTVQSLKMSIAIANKLSKNNYVVRDIMDYIYEVEETIKRLKDGEIKLKDGICPGMEEEFKEK